MDNKTNINEATMREAVAARNPDYDNQFVYAVLTTGVYCRPSCSARAARPENLRFFDSADSAIHAGFRACKRCMPDDPHRDVRHMIELARYIDANADETLPLSKLAKKMNLSSSYLQRSFKAVLGVSPKAYQNAARMKLFKSKLKTGDSITTAIYEAGYGSSSRVYEKTRSNIGMTPKAYREGGDGEKISYAFCKSSFGPLMMAATDSGICFVMFGDSVSSLLDQLTNEFPNACISPTTQNDNTSLDQWMIALEYHLTVGRPLPEAPLDLRGTAFQIKVWQFLLTIPEGEIVSYTDVAIGVEKPGAARAAASACGKNKIALFIPCHRVLRGDGSIGGYRWDVERKRSLLDREHNAFIQRSKS